MFTQAQLRDALLLMGENPSNEEEHEIMRQFGADEQGFVRLAEFAHAIARADKNILEVRQSLLKYRQVFLALDPQDLVVQRSMLQVFTNNMICAEEDPPFLQRAVSFRGLEQRLNADAEAMPFRELVGVLAVYEDRHPRSSSINQHELRLLWDRISQTNEVFDMIDSGSDGSIDCEDVQRAFKENCIDASTTSIILFMGAADIRECSSCLLDHRS